ncbi:MAG: single-stranded DNA-binding protein [Pyrinomonadaceae bacterium]
MSFNKLIVVGNLGRDPELRYTPQGTPLCTFSIASNERRKTSAGEQQDVTTWFRVTVWGRQAETVAQYLTKGKSVFVEGRLHVEEWTDKDGKPRHTLELNASDVQFLGGAGGGDKIGIPAAATRPGGAARAAAQTAGGAPQTAADEDDDGIPF